MAYLHEITIAGRKEKLDVIVGDEFAAAIARYDFKDMKEFNKVYQAQSRCTEKGLYSWCPADTRNLKKYLGME